MSSIDVGASPAFSGIARWTKRFLFDLPAPDGGGIVWPVSATAVWLLAILRATLLGYAFGFIPVPLFGANYVASAGGRAWASIGFVAFEELARLAYGLAARRPVRAWIVFLVLIEAVETIAYAYTGMAEAIAHHHAFVSPAVYLLSRAPAIVVHVLATAALIFTWKRKRQFLGPVFLAVTLAHALFDFAAPFIVTAVTGLGQMTPSLH